MIGTASETPEPSREMTSDNPEGATGAAPETSINAIMASIRAGIAGGAAIGAEPNTGVPLSPPLPSSRFPSPPGTLARTALSSAPASPAGAATAADGITLEALVRSMLAPMLKEWLDAHLPEIVETATHVEIRRLTGRNE